MPNTSPPADALLREFGDHLGIQGLQFDAFQHACLALDDLVLNLEYEDEEDELLMYIHLGSAPADADKAFFVQLLEANFGGVMLGGASLGYNAGRNLLLLTSRLGLAGADVGKLERRVHQLLQVADSWQQRLAARSSSESPQDERDFHQGNSLRV